MLCTHTHVRESYTEIKAQIRHKSLKIVASYLLVYVSPSKPLASPVKQKLPGHRGGTSKRISVLRSIAVPFSGDNIVGNTEQRGERPCHQCRT
jgi:hypothetical protein